MKPTLTPVSGFSIQDLDHSEFKRITGVLSQLKGDYETSTNLSYTVFILNLEKEIEKLLCNENLTWEQIFDLWEDQRIVRDAIVDDYYDCLIP